MSKEVWDGQKWTTLEELEKRLNYKSSYNLAPGMRLGKREKEILQFLNQHCGLFWARLHEIAGVSGWKRLHLEDEVQKELWNKQYHMSYDEWNKLVQKEVQKRIQRLYIYYLTSLKSLIRKDLVWEEKQRWCIHRTIDEDEVYVTPAGPNTRYVKEMNVTTYRLSDLGLEVAEKLKE